MRISDVPNSAIYFQRGAIVQLVVQLIDLNTGLPLQIQTATNLIVSLLYPDLITSQTFVASLYTDGSDGCLVYTTKNDGSSEIDLQQCGLYQIQGQVTLGGIVQPWSQQSDFYVRANSTDTGVPPVVFAASAFVLFDSNNIRWATTITTGGVLTPNAQVTGPANALTLHNLVLKDDTGVYWTVTISTLGVLVVTQGGDFSTAIDRLTLTDIDGITWIITVSEAGALVPE